jgi:ribosomal protein L11 methyltransferase
VEISITLDPVTHEALGAFLFDLGCEGLVTQGFQDATVKAYLPFMENLEDIRTRIDQFLQKLTTIFPQVGASQVSFKTIEDQDWNRNWRRFFRPDKITHELLIVPAWEPVPDSWNNHIIRLDPGPAFGTGKHPTTRMCLQAMEDLPVGRGWSLLDVGTGSGILSLYGAVLGARRVVALDTDPEAIRWAERNAALNRRMGAIHFALTPLDQIDDHFTVVAANLILGTILDLFPYLSRVMEKEGWLILSGILQGQVPAIEEVLPKYDLIKQGLLELEEWACLVGRRVR